MNSDPTQNARGETESARAPATGPEFSLGTVQQIGVAIIQNSDHFLVGIREEHQTLAGMHEFPGGKCEQHESASDCVIRESFEETRQVVTPRELIHQTRHVYPHATVEIEFYLCELSDVVQQTLPERFRWVKGAELIELNFPAANAEVLKLLAARFEG